MQLIPWTQGADKKECPLLVITRTPNKSLYIGDEIQIKVIKVDGNTVSLGITAPKHILIVRSEQHETSLDDNPVVTVRHV